MMQTQHIEKKASLYTALAEKMKKIKITKNRVSMCCKCCGAYNLL
jgi:hypothetical protein